MNEIKKIQRDTSIRPVEIPQRTKRCRLSTYHIVDCLFIVPCLHKSSELANYILELFGVVNTGPSDQ